MDQVNFEHEGRTVRRGWLKNGNPPGDLSKAKKCGAKTRKNTPCLGPAMRNGRCRMHGGASTGPRTAAGIETIRRSRTIHGFYSRSAIEQRRQARATRRLLAQLLDQLRA